MLRQAGLAGRLDRQGLVHDGLLLRFDGGQYRIPFGDLTDWTTTMYGQQEVVKDLIAARLADGGQVHFGVPDVTVREVTSQAVVTCTLDDGPVEVKGHFLAGCDGFHGVCRKSVPAGELTAFQHDYPFAWLGILAQAPPANAELVYAAHRHGFALHSMRSPTVSRLYLQVSRDETLEQWPDDRIWAELDIRLAVDGGQTIIRGPITGRSMTQMHSFVVEPMQYRRLFLVGDAAHIVPPSAAKGLNLAVSDARQLAGAFGAWYDDGDREPLDEYSRTCLRAVWQAQGFSDLMTALLHTDPGGYQDRLRTARLRELVTSHATALAFAEGYVGLSRHALLGGERTTRGLRPVSDRPVSDRPVPDLAAGSAQGSR